MAIVKRSIFYFVLVGAITILQAYSVGISPTETLTSGYFYLVPAAVIVAGLLLGLFSYLIIQYSKRIKSFFLFGLNIGFTAFILLLIFFRIQNWRSHQRYGYDPSAWSMLKTADEDGYRYVPTAFELLQSRVASPHNLHLKSYVIRSRDTLMQNGTSTIHAIYFTYYFTGDGTKYFSKVSVLNDQATLSTFNVLADTSSEHIPMEFKVNGELKNKIDSLRPVLGDDFIEFLESRY